VGNVLAINFVWIYFRISAIFKFQICVTAQTGNGLATQAITVKTSYGAGHLVTATFGQWPIWPGCKKLLLY